jgi:hypothetical protein
MKTLLSRSHDRRGAVRSATALAIAGIASGARSTDAARGWCRSDPLILIDGELADIFCTAPLSMLLKATGPNQIVVTVPKGVKTHLVLAGIGFGRGEKVTFKTSKKLKKKNGRIDVVVKALIPAKEDLPVGVEFAPRILGILNPDTAEGFANSWVTLKTKF